MVDNAREVTLKLYVRMLIDALKHIVKKIEQGEELGPSVRLMKDTIKRYEDDESLKL